MVVLHSGGDADQRLDARFPAPLRSAASPYMNVLGGPHMRQTRAGSISKLNGSTIYRWQNDACSTTKFETGRFSGSTAKGFVRFLLFISMQAPVKAVLDFGGENMRAACERRHGAQQCTRWPAISADEVGLMAQLLAPRLYGCWQAEQQPPMEDGRTGVFGKQT